MQNSTPFLTLCALFVFSVAARAAAPAGSAVKFQPIAAGALADVNAKDGDAAFNTHYFATARPKRIFHTLIGFRDCPTVDALVFWRLP